jgi:fido (protein-threonine AMPylation protein)
MYNRVWRWAGDYRGRDTNIVRSNPDQQQLYQLVGSTLWWIEKKTFEPDEIAVRYKHGLVKIHPFRNGNGRWSRLMGDVLARHLDRPVFSWGGSQLVDDDVVRKAYLAAVKKATATTF